MSDIPTIRVIERNGRWVTSDNRRLWVFKHLERLGFIDEIPVYQTHWVNDNKFTSTNDGAKVTVRGDPGGVWHRKRSGSAIGRSSSYNQSVGSFGTSTRQPTSTKRSVFPQSSFRSGQEAYQPPSYNRPKTSNPYVKAYHHTNNGPECPCVIL